MADSQEDVTMPMKRWIRLLLLALVLGSPILNTACIIVVDEGGKHGRHHNHDDHDDDDDDDDDNND
jgi:hypothetical protein